MAYYVRVLSTSPDCIPLSVINAALADSPFHATLTTEDAEGSEWNQATLRHKDGAEIAVLERNPVRDGTLGYNELAELTEEVVGCQPAVASQWLVQYLAGVECIYALQVLDGVDQPDGWEILDVVKSALWSEAPSIVQTDLEGFTNEDGFHILWQFDDETAEGTCWMGILKGGQWIHFEMDLGNETQRADFLAGKVPDRVTLATNDGDAH